jgi:cytochrome P450
VRLLVWQLLQYARIPLLQPYIHQLINLEALIITTIYRLYFHPLAQYPGPKTWSLTRLCYANAFRRGDLHLRILELHEKYGTIVRVAPDELSFITRSAMQDMCTGGPRNKGLARNPIVFGAQGNNSFLSGTDEQHSEFRRMLLPAFSAHARPQMESVVQEKATLCMNQLHRFANEGSSVNIVEWFNFFTFDVVGELAFSESFGQLERRTYDPWVQLIFSHLKYSSLSICLRYWPPLDVLMPKIAPASLLRLKTIFCELSQEKIRRRLHRKDEQQLQDWISLYLGSKSGGRIIDEDEVMESFTAVLIAGSETTATVLAGLLNYLCRNESVLHRLQSEIRIFASEDEITFNSTSKLPYLNASLNEALRLCNPLPNALGRVTPPEGAIISGQRIPGNVSS